MKRSLQLGSVVLTMTLLLAACAGTPKATGTYVDPDGRFSVPLIGEWEQLETNMPHPLLDVPGIDISMYIVTVESDDLEAGAIEALEQVEIDPKALTRTNSVQFGDWFIVFYSLGEGRGVSTLTQMHEGTSYVIVATGDEGLTQNPPEHVMHTIQGFAIFGAEVPLPRTVAEFEEYINGFVGDIPPALSIVISLENEIIYSKGFGMADGPKGMRAQPDTVYLWGSVVKIPTATAIMQLHEKGLVDLDDPVHDYLDYCPGEYGMTVRQLLSHSTGMGTPSEFVVANLTLPNQELPDLDVVSRKYFEQFTGPIFEPGTASSYFDPGFVMLGQIITEVSGQPYIDYIRENILTPLGMANTDFTYGSKSMIAKAAAGAFPAVQVPDVIAMADEARGMGDGAEFVREVDDRHAWMTRFIDIAAAGGLVGPATDMIRFAQMHLNKGEFDGARILSSESVALMQDMQLSPKDQPLGYGLGWVVISEGEFPHIEHGGGGVGLFNMMRLYPQENTAIVLMSNAIGFDRGRVMDAAANVVFSTR